MKNFRKISLLVILGAIGLCLALLVISALFNLRLPKESDVIDSLSAADKIRLAEFNHLRITVGDSVWPGWGQADIPVINYNESFAFLVGVVDPTDGWTKVPDGAMLGGPWKVVPDDIFSNQPYFRQPLLDPDQTPEAFTVLVGKEWVASLPTFDWMKISLEHQLRQDLPGLLQPVFPYQFFIQQLLGGSDKYISLLAHESFHAYQGMTASEKLTRAENTNRQSAGTYPWHDDAFEAGWQDELSTLAEALGASDQTETLELVRRFLALRSMRRETANLEPEFVAYEQQREWLEGLARYAELEIWRQAAMGHYTPVSESAELKDFDAYQTYETRWKQEVSQITRMANDEGDGRFYYTGMAQAFLLDRLIPDWKEQAMNEDIWLEDLLAEAVTAK